jgi:hypothetical protein
MQAAKYQLISTNLGGNIHDACILLNRIALAEYVISLDFSGSATVAVLKVPAKLAPPIREYLDFVNPNNEPLAPHIANKPWAYGEFYP